MKQLGLILAGVMLMSACPPSQLCADATQHHIHFWHVGEQDGRCKVASADMNGQVLSEICPV